MAKEKKENKSLKEREEKVRKENEKEEKVKEIPKIKLKERQNKQLIWALTLMILVILIIIFVPIFIRNFIDSFSYSGLKFQKTKMGELMFYSTRIPLLDKDGNSIGTYAMNFRNDPRKLNYIGKEIDNNVSFLRKNTVLVSVQGDAPICEDNLIAVAALTDFLRNFGALNVKGAMSDAKSANESGFPYVTCENSTYNTVIMIKSGNESIIKKNYKNCYEIQYKDCEINQAVEKFILIIIENYMSYIKGK